MAVSVFVGLRHNTTAPPSPSPSPVRVTRLREPGIHYCRNPSCCQSGPQRAGIMEAVAVPLCTWEKLPQERVLKSVRFPFDSISMHRRHPRATPDVLRMR